MTILVDNGVPKPVAKCLPADRIFYARQVGWHELNTAN
jgi:hypothetical protein